MRNVRKLLVGVNERANEKSKSRDEYVAKEATKFLNYTELIASSFERPAFMTGLLFLNVWDGGHSPLEKGFIYKDCFYRVIGHFTDEQNQLLIMEFADSERKHFEKLHAKFLSPEAKEASKKRPAIPEAVRIAVWRRDGGKCVECGRQENLEYDHIIPVEKGGASTVRNIQLLCTSCNRKKGNRVDETTDFRLVG